MTLAQAKKRYTPAEYYALEEQATYKSDYYEGEIFDMSGGTATHSLIIMNLGIAVGSRLRGKPCTAYDSNMRLKIEASSLRTYPDVTVYCEKLRYDPEDPRNTTALNPTALFEVLSPTTESYDRGLKAVNYRLVKSLRAYAFVAKDRPSVELHYRQPSGEWAIKDIHGMEASVLLEAIGIELPLSEIYEKVDFAADNPPKPNTP
jgi:Uma2 family endonuclease